jgi:hypothetical protein
MLSADLFSNKNHRWSCLASRTKRPWLLFVVLLAHFAVLCTAQSAQQSFGDAPADQYSGQEQLPSPNCPGPSVSEHADAYQFNAGVFTATIVQVTDSGKGNYNIVRINIVFKNNTNHPIMLAYHTHTSLLSDDSSNTYFCAKAGEGPDTSVTGMGTDADGKTDPQFILQPQESDSATFEMWGRRDSHVHAPLFHYDVTIDELDASDPKKILRQHSIYFGDFSTRSRNPARPNRLSK